MSVCGNLHSVSLGYRLRSSGSSCGTPSVHHFQSFQVHCSGAGVSDFTPKGPQAPLVFMISMIISEANLGLVNKGCRLLSLSACNFKIPALANRWALLLGMETRPAVVYGNQPVPLQHGATEQHTMCSNVAGWDACIPLPTSAPHRTTAADITCLSRIRSGDCGNGHSNTTAHSKLQTCYSSITQMDSVYSPTVEDCMGAVKR